MISPRQRDVLQLLAEGKTSKDIASTLHLSVETVKDYRRQARVAMRVRTTTHAVAEAIRKGLIE